jgi:hypothetical protein
MRATAVVCLVLVLGAGACQRTAPACTLEAERAGALAIDGGVVHGTDVVVNVDKSDFAMTETDTHRVTLGGFVVTFDESSYKGLTNQSVDDVEVRDPSCSNSVHVQAPPGCAFALHEVHTDEYDLFCGGYAGADYAVARLKRVHRK